MGAGSRLLLVAWMQAMVVDGGGLEVVAADGIWRICRQLEGQQQPVGCRPVQQCPDVPAMSMSGRSKICHVVRPKKLRWWF